MKYKLIFIVSIIASSGCGSPESPSSQPVSDTTDANIVAEQKFKLYGSKLDDYILSHSNMADTITGKMSVIYSDTEKTDTAIYEVFQLGHDVIEEEGGKRFVTDAWIWINTKTQKLYEEDVSGKTLVPSE